MLGITSKFEIHIDDNDIIHPDKVMDFAKRYKCAAVVVSPDQFNTYFISKITRNADTKLGIMIDFPNGNRQGVRKFHDMPTDAAEAEIFEIMVKDKEIASTYKKEIESLTITIKKTINHTAEVRIVLNSHHRSQEVVESVLKAARNAGCSMVRTNHFVVGTKGLKHIDAVLQIKNLASMPIKVSGNVDIDVIREVGALIGNKGRYAVDFEQATKIVNQLKADDKLAKELQNLATIENVEELKNATVEDLHEVLDKYAESFVESLGIDEAKLSLVTSEDKCHIRVSVLPGQKDMVEADTIPFLIGSRVVKIAIEIVADSKLSI